MTNARANTVAMALTSCLVASCGGGDDARDARASGAGAAPERAAAGRTFVGCVAQTGQPDVFLLSIVHARDAQGDSPAGTAVPQTNPPAASAAQAVDPNAPVATGGSDAAARPQIPASTGSGPGAGPTTTASIQSYRLSGSGGLELGAHVGHTIEVTGSIVEAPGERRTDGTEPVMGELRVESARAIADECVR